MAAAAAVKSDLLIKDELDAVIVDQNSVPSGTLLVTSLKNNKTESFKSSSNDSGDIKDEFTDEMEDAVVCETNTDDDDENGSGDQDTETDELNDAEEIGDEMAMIEEVEEGSSSLLLDEAEHHDAELLVHEDNDGNDEVDPLNDPLLGDHLAHSEANGEADVDEEEMNGDDDGDDNHDAAATDESKLSEESAVVVVENSSNGRGGKRAGVKRKAAEAEVATEEDNNKSGAATTTVRKSSRIRNLLDLRREKEEAMLQGKSVHDAQKEKTKMLQRPEERRTRLDEDAEVSEPEPDKDEAEVQGPPPAVQGDPTRPPGADSTRKIDIDFLLPFRLGWTREVVHRSVKTGPPQVDIYYWPPKDGKDMGSKNREYRRKRRSKVDQERYFEDFPHPSLSVNNFTYVRRPLGLNNEAYELVRQEVRSGLETRSEKRTRSKQVASYKEVAEHVGLLSGSSSEEEKEEEVEDITDFDQGLPLSIQIIQRTTPLRDEFKKRHKPTERDRCLTPPLAEDLLWTQLDDDPLGIFTDMGGRSSPATPPPLRALRLTSHATVDTIRDKHRQIRDGLPDPLVRITADNKDLELKENLMGHDVAIKKWRNFRAAPPPARFLPQQQQQRRFLPTPTARPFIRPGPGRPGGQQQSPYQQAAVGSLVTPYPRQNMGFVKVRLPMLSTNGKRPVVELVMLTNGKYQPIKFTNNRQVTESIPKRLFEQANALKKTLYQRSVQVPKIGTKQVFVAINPGSTGFKPAVPPPLAAQQQQQQVAKPAMPQQPTDQVSILVRPAQGGNAVLLNVPRSVALKVKIGTTLSFSASNDQKYTVIDNKMHPPVGRGKPVFQPRPPQPPAPSAAALQQVNRILPNLPSSVSIRPVVRQVPSRPPGLVRPPQQQQPWQQQLSWQQQQQQQQQRAQLHFRQLRHEQIQQLRQKQRTAIRAASPDLSSFTPCSPFCPGVSGIPELECSSCHSLFHPKCVGIPPGRLTSLSASFICKGCTARSGSSGAGGAGGVASVQVIDLD